jgi:thiol-disulfide isomerase/thioredoxin
MIVASLLLAADAPKEGAKSDSKASSGDEIRQDEAEKLYRQFVRDFDGRNASDHVEKELRRNAQRALEEIRIRGVGKPAPEIEGEDLDGKSMKLSDFRGKVLLVSFWATWCGPCMKLVPHERSLAKRLRGEPFALVGINGDVEPEQLRKALEEYEITWRSFKDKRAEGKPIAAEWQVSGWPTLYLIDHQGIIRKRWVGSPAVKVLDREIDLLVKEAIPALAFKAVR